MPKSGKKKKKSGNVTSSGVAMAVPTTDVCVIARNCVARYECNATLTNQSVNVRELISTLLVQANTTTTVSSTFYGLRIKKLIYYTPAVVSSTTSAMSFEWYTQSGNAFGTQPASKVLGSTGTAFGARHEFIPYKDSPWSKWVTITNPGSVTMWIHSVPSGTTLDIVYDAYCDNGDTTFQHTVSGAVAGANYRMGFDGLASATSNWIPLGYARI